MKKRLSQYDINELFRKIALKPTRKANSMLLKCLDVDIHNSICYLDKNQMQDIISNYIPLRLIELKSEIDSCDIKFVNPEELLDKLFSIENMEHKLKILWYLRLLSFLPENKSKFKLEPLLKPLGFDFNLFSRTYIPLKYPVKCKLCGEICYVDNISKGRCIQHDIYCSCGHKLTQKSSNDCGCKSCISIRKELVDKFTEIANQFKKEFLDYFDEKYPLLEHELKKYIIEEKELKQWHTVSRNNLTKTERLTLQLNPRSLDELYASINLVIDEKKNWLSLRDSLIENLEKHGIIYNEYKLKPKSEIINQMQEDIDLVFKNEGTPYQGFYHFDFSNIKLVECKTKINQHYINEEKIVELPKNKVQTRHNIFKSNAEICQFDSLRAKYNDFLILPNYQLRNAINLEDIKDEFSESEMKYLKYCVADFVIANKEGYVVKVVEVQKGKHHDTKEWIKKDYLKKKAVLLSGIQYEETF